MVCDLLHHLDTHTCTKVNRARSDQPKGKGGSAGRSAHRAISCHLPAVLAKGRGPIDWRLPNVTFIYEKCCKEDLGSYRPIRLTSALGKVMELIILGAITDTGRTIW